jgi:hypothetical protein
MLISIHLFFVRHGAASLWKDGFPRAWCDEIEMPTAKALPRGTALVGKAPCAASKREMVPPA